MKTKREFLEPLNLPVFGTPQLDWHPEAVDNTLRIAEECAQDGIVPIAEEVVPKYRSLPNHCASSGQHLRELAYAGSRERRGAKAETHAARSRLNYELKLLDTLGYSDFVLHAAHIVREARW